MVQRYMQKSKSVAPQVFLICNRCASTSSIPRQSVTNRVSKVERLKPFHKYNPSSNKVEPVKTFTESCQAHPMMYKHLGITTKRMEATDGQSGPRYYETTLYEHPREVAMSSDLSCRDINTMYCISNADLARYFPEGVGGKVAQTFVPGHPRGFLYRKQSHLLNVFIQKMAEKKWGACRLFRNGLSGVIFDGETGAGKSALLCQAVHFARSRNVLVLYVPDASKWSHGEYAWPSVLLPGFFDVPDASRSLLQYFAQANQPILESMPLRVTPNNLPVERVESPVRTLYDLCMWGCRSIAPLSIERQSIALKYLMDELRGVTDVPVLYVVDGINLISMDSHFRYPHPDFLRQMKTFSDVDTDMDLFVKEMPRIPCARLSFVRALNRLMLDIAGSDAHPNQCVIGCTTRWFKENKVAIAFPKRETDRKYKALDEYTPFYCDRDTLLHPMEVSNFDEYEYRSYLRFLVNSGEVAGHGWGPLWHHSSSFERKLYKIEFMSQRNPQRVIDHYHQEFLWKFEFERIRQKQNWTKLNATMAV